MNFSALINRILTLFQSLPFLCVITSLLEMFFLAHGSVAFPDIEYTMRADEYWANKTDTELTTVYSWLFSTMTAVALLITFCFTVLVDYQGFWVGRYIIHVASTIGGIFMLLMSKYHFENLAFVGIPLFYGASRAFNAGHALISKLYPEKSSFILNLQYLPMALSQTLYMIYIHLNVNYQWIFWLLVLLTQPLSILRTFYFLPRYNLNKNNETGEFKLGKETWNDPPIIKKKKKRRNQSGDNPNPNDVENDETEISIKETPNPDTLDKNNNKIDFETTKIDQKCQNDTQSATQVPEVQVSVQNVNSVQPTPTKVHDPNQCWLKSIATLPNFLCCAIPAIQSVRLAAYTAQFQSLLKYEVAHDHKYTTEEEREEAILYYSKIVMYSIASNIIGLPLQGLAFDKLREFLQNRFESLNIEKATIVVSLIKFFYVCCTLFLSNLLMLLPGTGWPFIISIFLRSW